MVTIGSKYLPLSPDIDTAIVGQCACCTAPKASAELSSLGLPTPDWKLTAESIRRHFPAGFENSCGVWFRVDSAQCGASDGEEYKAHLTKVLKTIITSTDLKVRYIKWGISPFTKIHVHVTDEPLLQFSRFFPKWLAR